MRGIQKRWPRALVTVAWLLMIVFLGGTAAALQSGNDSDSDDQIVLNGRLDVLEGETAGTAVIFNGPARIEGTVAETLVVFNGRTEISGTVREDVVVFNGSVVVASGAEIGGDLVTRETPQVAEGATVRGERQQVTTRFNSEDFGFASSIAWWIGFSVSTLILGLLLLLLAPGLDRGILDAARNRTGASIGMGIAAFLLLPIVGVLLLVIIVAIPLGIFILLALGLLYTVGYVAGALAIGRLFVKPPSSRFLAFLAGWVVLRLLALIPVVGGLVWLLAAIFGLGVLAVAARRTSAPETTAAFPPPPPQPAGSG